MAAIYEEITLAWDGQEYTVQPDYRMVQRIERRGISIIGVCNRIQTGDPPTSQVAEIIAHMLTSGGAKGATPERVYAHLAAKADADEWSAICTAIIMGFIPQETDPGNSGGPANGADVKADAKAETEKSPT